MSSSDHDRCGAKGVFGEGCRATAPCIKIDKHQIIIAISFYTTGDAGKLYTVNR